MTDCVNWKYLWWWLCKKKNQNIKSQQTEIYPLKYKQTQSGLLVDNFKSLINEKKKL